MQEPFALDTLTAADTHACWQLSHALRWPHREADWQQFITWAKAHGAALAVRAGGQLIGCGLAWQWGHDQGSIGMVIVDDAWQRRGIGKQLFRGLLQALEGRDVMLQATAQGRPLYESLGFAAIGHARQFHGHWQPPAEAGPTVSLAVDERTRLLQPQDVPALLAYDQRERGLARPALLQALLAQMDADERCAVSVDEQGHLCGYGILRRWWTLRRHFLNCDPGPIWQDWRRLYDDTGDVSDEHYLTAWPRLRELMRYHLPLAGLRYGWFIDIAICFLLPAYSAYTGPRPNPYAAYRCITCPAAPATSLEPGLPLASILITWLLLRGAHILWRTKYAISAGWLPPRPQDGLSLHITLIAYILGLIYSLIPANWRLLPAQTTVQNITAILSLSIYRYSWWYLPPDAVNLRRAMFDHGLITVLIVAACIIGNLPGSDEHAFIVKTPLLTALSLITAPALALVLIYSYAPPPPNRKTAKHLATAATILMVLGISAISYNVFRKDIPGPVAVLLGLIVAISITARNPPRPETIHHSLAALIHFLALACLYILAYVAILNLIGSIKAYTGDAWPGIILLASLILHSIATLSHYNWRRKHT